MSRLLIFLISGFLATTVVAQEGSPDHSVEVHALAAGASGGIDTSNSSAGFLAGIGWRPSPRVSLVADYERLFATQGHATFNTFLAGPRLYSADHGGLSGFIQLRAGAEQTAIAGQPAGWNVVWGPGAGVDIHLFRGLVWRAIEVDVTLNHRSDPGIPSISYASGIVLRFGH